MTDLILQENLAEEIHLLLNGIPDDPSTKSTSLQPLSPHTEELLTNIKYKLSVKDHQLRQESLLCESQRLKQVNGKKVGWG